MPQTWSRSMACSFRICSAVCVMGFALFAIGYLVLV